MNKLRETSKFIVQNNNVNNDEVDDNDDEDDDFDNNADDHDDDSDDHDDDHDDGDNESFDENKTSRINSNIRCRSTKASRKRLDNIFELIEYEVKENIFKQLYNDLNNNNSSSSSSSSNYNNNLNYDYNNNIENENNKINLMKILEGNDEQVQSEILSLQLLLHTQQSEIDRLLSYK